MSRAEVSARIGDRLLTGWTLLGEACPRACCATPLLRSRQGELYCPQHDGPVDAAEAHSAPCAPEKTTLSHDAQSDERLGPFARPMDAREPPFDEPPQSSDALANSIADLMLEGWAMTATVCPIEGCRSPLLRQRYTKKLWCAAHCMWVVTEAEALSAKLSSVQLEEAVAAVETVAPFCVTGT
jgi:uncharacterized Zn finger protein (UPF0148 family)